MTQAEAMLFNLLHPTERTMRRVRLVAFVLPLLMPFALWHASELGRRTGDWDAFAFMPVAMVFFVITALDYVIGRDTINVPPRTPQFRHWYRALPLLVVPLHLGSLVWAAYMFTTLPFSWIGQLGWVLSMGTISGVLAINVAHELIHKSSRLEQIGGGLLLASVGYGSFKVEHVYGHHAWVATDKDASSAKRGETIYGFVPRAIVSNIANAFALQHAHAARLGMAFWSWRNEMLWWSGITVALAIGAYVWLGPMGLLFFAAQGVIAIVQLEMVNYIEHYGLRRAFDEKGRPERVTPMHSWNSSYFLTNAYLFQLQRHADHHANAARPYQDLQHHEGAPQLPGGYGAMMLLSTIPPLWRAVIHPRLDAVQGHEAR